MHTETGTQNFLGRLIGGIAAGLALILLAYSAYLSFQRVPLTKEVLKDFGTKIPAITLFVFSVPWLPLIIALLALGCGLAATFVPSRSLLVVASVSTLLAIAAVLFTQYAMELPRLIIGQAIAGG